MLQLVLPTLRALTATSTLPTTVYPYITPPPTYVTGVPLANIGNWTNSAGCDDEGELTPGPLSCLVNDCMGQYTIAFTVNTTCFIPIVTTQDGSIIPTLSSTATSSVIDGLHWGYSHRPWELGEELHAAPRNCSDYPLPREEFLGFNQTCANEYDCYNQCRKTGKQYQVAVWAIFGFTVGSWLGALVGIGYWIGASMKKRRQKRAAQNQSKMMEEQPQSALPQSTQNTGLGQLDAAPSASAAGALQGSGGVAPQSDASAEGMGPSSQKAGEPTAASGQATSRAADVGQSATSGDAAMTGEASGVGQASGAGKTANAGQAADAGQAANAGHESAARQVSSEGRQFIQRHGQAISGGEQSLPGYETSGYQTSWARDEKRPI